MGVEFDGNVIGLDIEVFTLKFLFLIGLCLINYFIVVGKWTDHACLLIMKLFIMH